MIRKVGAARNVMNKENNKSNTRFDRGKKTSTLSTLGIWELMAIDYLTKCIMLMY